MTEFPSTVPEPKRQFSPWLLSFLLLTVAYGLLALTLAEPLSHSTVMQRCVLVNPKMARIWSVGNIEIGLAYLGVFVGMTSYFIRIFRLNRAHLADLGIACLYLIFSFLIDFLCVQHLQPFVALLIGDAVIMTFTVIVSRQLWFQRLLGVFVPIIFLTCGIGHFLEGLSYWQLTYPFNVPWTMVTADIGFAVLVNSARFPAFIRGQDMVEELQESQQHSEELQQQLAISNQAKAALQASEERLRLAMEAAHIGIWDWDIVTSQITWSEQADDTHGAETESFASRLEDYLSMIHPEDRERVSTAMQDAIEIDAALQVEFRIIKPGREALWFSVRGQFLRDEAGKPLRMIGTIQDVTASKAAQKLLRDSEERTHLATEATGVGIWEWNVLTNKIRWDVQMFRIYGIAPTEDGFVAYNTWTDSVLPEDLPRQEELLQDTVRRLGHSSREFCIRRPDNGEIRHIQAVETVRTNDQKQAEWVVGTNLDITEQRQLELAQQVQAAIIESSFDAILSKTPEGIITSWNTGAERLYGYTRQEVLGQHISLLIPFPQSSELSEIMGHVLSGEQIKPFETVRQHKDGSLLTVLLTISPVYNVHQEIIGASAIAHDITERKHMEEALVESEARIRTILDTTVDAIVTINEQGVIESFNGSAQEMFGYWEEEIVGHNVQMLMPTSHSENHDVYLARYRETREKKILGSVREVEARRKDGTLFSVELAVSEVRFGDQRRFTGVLHDITERKQAEESITRYVEELKRSNEELQQFAYVASHDLQEPLRMVASYTELFARRFEKTLDEKANKYIHYIVEGAERMQHLVNDLLTISRVGTEGKPLKPVDAEVALRHVLQNLEVLIRDTNADIRFETLPTIMFDPVQFEQLMQNLLVNALKFRSERSPRIEIHAEKQEEFWQFAVRDNGIGIEKQYAEQIFQMFKRLHNRQEYEGNGIGLAVIKKVIERHGGRIWFDSTPGEGTTFFFTVPVVST